MGYPNTETLNRDIIFEEADEGTLRNSSVVNKNKQGYFPPLGGSNFPNKNKNHSIPANFQS